MSVSHGVPMDWPLVLSSTLPRWLLLAVVMPFVLHVANRVPLTPARVRVVVLQLSIFFVVSISQATVSALTTGHTSPISLLFSWPARVTRVWYNTMPMMVSIYGAVLMAAWGLAESRERHRRTLRASQLEAQLHGARLASLRAQLQPHFLYNTLNGIAALVSDIQPARAVAAIEQLADLLHVSLREDGRHEITVAEELALAERYLALQEMRFGDRLTSEWRVSPEVSENMVPVLLLQPIIENAVVHGLEAGQSLLHIVIGAREVVDGVELFVENNGPALDIAESRGSGHGVGLAATRARLSTAYGDRASLTLAPRQGGGAIVRIVVPSSAANAAGSTAVAEFALVPVA